eukprot:5700153-Karenia_brevis.AAC.1
MTINAHGWGKESSVTPVNKIRILMPQPAWLTISECIVYVKLLPYVNSICKTAPGTYIGGVKGSS